MDNSSEPKIFPPTDKKLNDLKKKGQFPKTEMSEGLFQLIMFCTLFCLFLYFVFEYIDELLIYILYSDSMINFYTITELAIYLVIVVGVCKLVLFFCNWIFISKSVISTEQLGFKMDKLNPVQGFKNNYGFSAAIKSLRSILSLIFLILIIKYNMSLFNNELNKLFQSNNKSYFLYLFLLYILYVTILFIIYAILIGIIDFMMEKFQFMKKNRMTLTEMKKEMKDTEGSPETKNKRKQLMRELVEEPSLFKGRKPNFALANPTHILIPICYEAEIDKAPYVMKITIDSLALQERAKLEKEEVLIIENKKLTQDVYNKMKKGEQYIVPEFYKHVAIIISLLKRHNKLKDIV